MASRTERFAALFDGLRRAYGRYVIPSDASPDGRGKIEGAAATWHKGFGLHRWEEHLAGTAGLGINPCRDDGTVRFVAIDVDVYDVDLPDYVDRVRKIGLPLVVCRSKSGGPHFYAFFSEDVPAQLATGRAAEWARLLGHGGCEIFPKNVSFERVEDGNWINMPYFAGDRTLRYGHGPDGNALDPDAFLDYAESSRVTVSFLEGWEPPEVVDLPNEDFLEAPPCLQILLKQDYAPGSRNNGLLGVGVYLKRRFPDDWRDRLWDYNQRYFHPPKGVADVQGVIRSVGQRNYLYQCNKEPFLTHCDRDMCLTREFGVGNQGDGGRNASAYPFELGVLYKIMMDPPIWRWLVNHEPVDLSTEQIRNQRLFLLRVFESCDLIVPPIANTAFDALVNARLPPQMVDVPEEGTFRGMVVTALADFCTRGKASAKTLDAILTGQTFTFGGRTSFLPRFFYEFLHLRKIGYNLNVLVKLLGDLGVQSHYDEIKGKPTTYWSVAEHGRQTEDHDVPRSEDKGPF